MKICIVSHTENFKENEEKYKWIIKRFKDLEENLEKKIPITWTLEEDNLIPFNFEIRAGNKGDTISEGRDFFKKLMNEGHELGVHSHFVRSHKIDFSYENQKRMIKNTKKKFISSFGIKPRSFVGGWWHSDNNTLKILEEEGFLVDASPMPLYKEIRRRWICGKIPTPFKIKACDWSDFKERTPVFFGKILRIPNAVDPNSDKFFINKTISLDLLDKQFEKSIDVFKNFKEKGINFLCIPFHPNFLTKDKIEKIFNFFIECEKIDSLEFLRLQDIYKIIKKNKNV
jgi:hypothetical protein